MNTADFKDMVDIYEEESTKNEDVISNIINIQSNANIQKDDLEIRVKRESLNEELQSKFHQIRFKKV